MLRNKYGKINPHLEVTPEVYRRRKCGEGVVKGNEERGGGGGGGGYIHNMYNPSKNLIYSVEFM